MKIIHCLLPALLLASCHKAPAADLCFRLFQISLNERGNECSQIKFFKDGTGYDPIGPKCVERAGHASMIDLSEAEPIAAGIVIEDYSGAILCEALVCGAGDDELLVNYSRDIFKTGVVDAFGIFERGINARNDAIAYLVSFPGGQNELALSYRAYRSEVMQSPRVTRCTQHQRSSELIST